MFDFSNLRSALMTGMLAPSEIGTSLVTFTYWGVIWAGAKLKAWRPGGTTRGLTAKG
jgi:hypothetical protein